MKKEVKRFKDTQIDEAVIHEIESAVTDMPGFCGQPYFFTFFTNRATLYALGEFAGEDMKGAPLMIAAFADPSVSSSEEITLMVLGGIALKLREKSLGSIYTDAFCTLFNSRRGTEVKKQCGIPAHYICTGALLAGEPDITEDSERHFNVFSYIR